MNETDILNLGKSLFIYCKKFNIPLEFVFEILEDQKVTPMIRGKAMEYNAFLLLKNLLPSKVWGVQKLNLNAQPGLYDEDISITHRRTGIILKVESKSAVRASINTGLKSKLLKVPHFKVKCHRSRSNIKLAGSSNDRYAVGSFDILITNPSNAIIEGNTVGESLELIHNEEIRQLLHKHYNTNNEANLISSCETDWRICIPQTIAIGGYIPRTPYVKLLNDENWKTISKLEDVLMSVVKEKRKKKKYKQSTEQT